jgi:hypothetical protein
MFGAIACLLVFCAGVLLRINCEVARLRQIIEVSVLETDAEKIRFEVMVDASGFGGHWRPSQSGEAREMLYQLGTFLMGIPLVVLSLVLILGLLQWVGFLAAG